MHPSMPGTMGAIVTVSLFGWLVCAVVLPASGDAAQASAADALTASRFGTGFVLATVATCLLESFTDQIDNLFLPLFYYAAILTFQTN